MAQGLLSVHAGSTDHYDQWYCPRGEMENRLKEHLNLFSTRTSSHYFLNNQFRPE